MLIEKKIQRVGEKNKEIVKVVEEINVEIKVLKEDER